MPTKKFVSPRRLSSFLSNLKKIFATKEDVLYVEDATNTYALNVDYSAIKFDTSEIIGQWSDES